SLFDTFLYNPLTPFFKGELNQLLHYLKSGKLFFNNHLYIALAISLTFLLITGCGEDSDNIRPTVVKTTPADRTSEVQLNTTIKVVFSEVIDPGSIDGAVEILPAISGSTTFEKDRFLTFSPSGTLNLETQYLVTVKGVRDQAGNEMEPYTFRFTSDQGDTSPPRVVQTIPGADEEDVDEDTRRIVIEFSEELDRTRAYSVFHAFHIQGSIGGEIGIWKAKWLNATTYELRLDSKLDNEEEVIVRIDKNYIADLLGNEMTEDYVSSFTAEGINPVGSPRNYSNRMLAYFIWQGTSGEWHIRWNTNFVRAAPPMFQSPSEPTPKPKPQPKPKPKGPSYQADQHYFSGTIISDGTITADLDPDSFSDGDLIQMEIKGNLVKVTGDEVIVQRDEANVVTVRANEIKIDGEMGNMVSATEDMVMIEGDIVTILDDVVTLEGTVLMVNDASITIEGNIGSIIVAEGKLLAVTGNVIVLEGEITSVTGSAVVVEGDIMIVQGNKIWFAGSTSSGDSGDGFDFKSDGLYLTFDIKIDNEYDKRGISIGEKGKSPQEIPFELKSRYDYRE
ncbi:Ig-like domain-containing protein, partial [Candidatus Poribacteria bacterium]